MHAPRSSIARIRRVIEQKISRDVVLWHQDVLLIRNVECEVAGDVIMRLLLV